MNEVKDADKRSPQSNIVNSQKYLVMDFLLKNKVNVEDLLAAKASTNLDDQGFIFGSNKIKPTQDILKAFGFHVQKLKGDLLFPGQKGKQQARTNFLAMFGRYLKAHGRSLEEFGLAYSGRTRTPIEFKSAKEIAEYTKQRAVAFAQQQQQQQQQQPKIE